MSHSTDVVFLLHGMAGDWMGGRRRVHIRWGFAATFVRFRSLLSFALLFMAGAIPTLATATDCYYQTLVPRIAPRPLLPSLCGSRVGRPQKTVIMADKPRQAALAAMQNPRLGVALADRAYSNAAAAERDEWSSCVDLYFEVVAFSWNFLKSPGSPDQPEYPQAWQLYHNGLQRLMETAERFGRLDLQKGLRVNTAAGPQTIAVTRSGFVWQANDFNRVVVVTDKLVGELTNHYYRPGLGVPLVIVRERLENERFRTKAIHFAATVVLRPSLAVLSGRAPPFGAQSSHGPVELYDPLRVSTVAVNGTMVKMATDTSAPLEVALHDDSFNPLLEMIRPDSGVAEEKLFMIEPYQPGKYPIVFVHGLMSSPKAWGNFANEILARPELRSRFQLWGFQYPTGVPFVASAATLRAELTAAVATCDPVGQDPTMSNMAVIGHSMGGLVAKLQVTSSDDRMWCSIAKRPLNEVQATAAQRERLRQLFYFEPLPFITRVVFIGTPHNGSALARRSIGRFGSCLIEQPSSTRMKHQQLIKDNPGVFLPYVSQKIPSSVDMLEPNSPMLKAIQQLCPSGNVQLHSIIGTGFPSLLHGPADGAVPVASAEHPFTSTDRYIHTTHGRLHSDPEAIEEFLCILRRHLWEAYDAPITESESLCGPEWMPELDSSCLDVPCPDVPCPDLQCTDLQCTDLQCTDLPCTDLPCLNSPQLNSPEFHRSESRGGCFGGM